MAACPSELSPERRAQLSRRIGRLAGPLGEADMEDELEDVLKFFDE